MAEKEEKEEKEEEKEEEVKVHSHSHYIILVRLGCDRGIFGVMYVGGWVRRKGCTSRSWILNGVQRKLVFGWPRDSRHPHR